MSWALPLVILLTLSALGLFWLSAREKRASGLPDGRVIYADPGQWGAVTEPFYDRELGLVGKPDYLVQQGEQIIPVEVKTGRAPQAPYDSHIFQLAAYCLLVQRCLGVRPAYGMLHYPGRTFAIDYTPELETALIELLNSLRLQDRRSEVGRSHRSAARCARCGFRSICDQRL